MPPSTASQRQICSARDCQFTAQLEISLYNDPLEEPNPDCPRLCVHHCQNNERAFRSGQFESHPITNKNKPGTPRYRWISRGRDWWNGKWHAAGESLSVPDLLKLNDNGRVDDGGNKDPWYS